MQHSAHNFDDAPLRSPSCRLASDSDIEASPKSGANRLTTVLVDLGYVCYHQIINGFVEDCYDMAPETRLYVGPASKVEFPPTYFT